MAAMQKLRSHVMGKTSTNKRLPKFNKPIAALLVIVLVVIGVALVYLSRAGSSTYSYNATTGKISGRLFSADSPINQVIPADVRYKADGPQRIATLPTAGVSLLEWSRPIFDVDGSASKVRIWCYLTNPNYVSDTCNGLNNRAVPVPNGVFAQRGGDGHLTVIDHSTREIFDYWIWRDCFLILNPVNASYCPARGDVGSIDGNGLGTATNVAGIGGGTIRTYEVEQGYIDHALVFSTPNTCKDFHFYPAQNRDGTHTENTCIPIGSRIQLDPSINVDAIAGITAFEKMVAKALQKYGAYCDDTGGIFGFVVEYDRTGRKVYQGAGVPDGSSYFLKSIPSSKLKMIEPQWNGDGTKAYEWGKTPQSTSSPKPVTTTSSPKPSTTSNNSTSSKPVTGSENYSTSSDTTSGGGDYVGENNTSEQGSASSSPSSGSSTKSQTSPTKTKENTYKSAVDSQSGLNIAAKVGYSFLFINYSSANWPDLEKADKYKVWINSESEQILDKNYVQWWHFGTSTQTLKVQPIDKDGNPIGDEVEIAYKPTCTWYSVCH
jgi:hypothetical protein